MSKQSIDDLTAEIDQLAMELMDVIRKGSNALK